MSGSNSERNIAERITLGISLAILIAILAAAGWTSYRIGDKPPEIQVEVGFEEIRSEEGNSYVPITITNHGGRTAQDLVITGELETGEGEPETAEITLEYLAGNESETAELVFTSEPNESNLTVRPTSYRNP